MGFPMKISCECYEKGLLPLDIEPALLDRSGGVCEICHESPAVEICTVGALREFARLADCCHVCKSCHVEKVHRVMVEESLRRHNPEKFGPCYLKENE